MTRERPDPHDADVGFAEWSGLFPERIETERLVLRRLSPETVDPLDVYEVCAHGEDIDEVTRHLTWDPHAHPKETAEFLADVESGWADGEVATWYVRPDPDQGEPPAEPFAGVTGLTLVWERRAGRLGVWLRKPFWGRGYSGERAAALLALAFDHLDLDVVAVSCDAGNERSRRAIEKYVGRFGGRHEGLLRNAAAVGGEPVDRHRFTVTSEEYRASLGD